MALRITPNGTNTKIQFVVPDDVHDGAISAVGTFNDWKPGVHKLLRRSNGTRSVTVAVPKGQRIQFRYLAEGGVWFDDEDAHAITPDGSFVEV
jgi:hypothetical protein